MLNSQYIDELVSMRLPGEVISKRLLELTPDKLDVEALALVVEAVQKTVVGVTPDLIEQGRQAIDCSGTGGSGLSHFNTSTTAAFILAAGGVKVMKIGNVAASSKCGSFDLLASLGFSSSVPAERAADIVQQSGLAFLFAPQYYPLLKQLAPIRKALGVKTIFNYIGPLLNPARPAFRLMGISDPRMQELVADYLSRDTNSALLVHADNGLDEISGTGATTVYRITDKSATKDKFVSPYRDKNGTPDLGVKDNAEIFQRLLHGEDKDSHYFRLVTLNAGAGFCASGKASSILEGQELACGLLASGDVKGQFEKCRRVYAKYAQ